MSTSPRILSSTGDLPSLLLNILTLVAIDKQDGGLYIISFFYGKQGLPDLNSELKVVQITLTQKFRRLSAFMHTFRKTYDV